MKIEDSGTVSGRRWGVVVVDGEAVRVILMVKLASKMLLRST